ncbi:MAG: hypothetical protein Q7N87_02155 [Candidatus Uhrbacteria bacterium]|nr:hypothetical protein [Candidatus Uhrbacteria bacterium]
MKREIGGFSPFLKEESSPGDLGSAASQIGFLSGILKHRGDKLRIVERRFLTRALASAMRASCVHQVYIKMMDAQAKGAPAVLAVEIFIERVVLWSTAPRHSPHAHFFRLVVAAEERFGIAHKIGFGIIAWHLLGHGDAFYRN